MNIFHRSERNFPIIAVFSIIGLLLFAALCLYFTHQNNDYLRDFTKIFKIIGIKKKDLIGRQPLKFPIKKPSAVVTQAPTPPPLPAKNEEPSALDYDREIKSLNDLIKRDSRNVDAFYNRAWLYASKNDLQQALKDYTRVIKINDKYGDAYYNRGLVYVRMGKYNMALKDFDSAIKLDHRAFDAYCNRGNTNYQLGKSDLGIKDYTEALRIKPNDADLYYNRGAVYLSKGQDSKAMADFKKAAQMGHTKAKERLK